MQKAKEAREQAAEATRQKGIAVQNANAAEKREKRAKGTADETIRQMIDLGKGLHNRLQSKRLSIAAAPEAPHCTWSCGGFARLARTTSPTNT